MRPITIEDKYSFVWVMDPAISPDGSQIVYTQTIVDAETKEYRSKLYTVATDGISNPRPFTGGTRRDTTPRWSPDGTHVAFVSDRSGENQIWMLPLAGGEATQLTRMRHGASNPRWSPDGSMIAFVAGMKSDDCMDKMLTPMSKAEKEARDKHKKEHAMIVDSVRYRFDAMGYFEGINSHIWVLNIADGSIIRVTEGDYQHADFAWSPCGSKIVLAANRNEDADLITWNSDIWTVSASGSDMQKLTATNGPCSNPVWSPDGSKIAYLGHLRECYGATISRIWLVNAGGGEPTCLTAGFDYGFGESGSTDMTHTAGSSLPLVWMPCGTKLLSVSNYHGRTQHYTIALDGKVELLVGGDCNTYGISLSADGKTIAISWNNHDIANEISVIRLPEREEKLLTDTNPWLRDVNLARTEEFWCKGDEGWDLQGWLMKPLDWQEGVKYPLILNIHGGPHNIYGFGFSHQFHTQAAAGYYVMYLNPRGGQGYGQKFQAGVNRAYGEGDYRDLMAAVDYIIANHPGVDESRLGVTGASYGGFMTNWIVSHTDRFKTAVTVASISNWISFFGVSDIGYHFCENQHGADPFSDFDYLVRISPLTHVKNITTPLLIVHSEQDYRCPIEQAEQLFVALKKLGRETRLLRFNNSSHTMARTGPPALRVDQHTHIMEWFAKYLG